MSVERRIHVIECDCGKPAQFHAQTLDFTCGNFGRFKVRCGFYMTELDAAYKKLGPFSRAFDPQRDYERVHIPGFVQTGPTSYERISEPDGKQIHREGLAAVRKLAKRGEW